MTHMVIFKSLIMKFGSRSVKFIVIHIIHYSRGAIE